MRSEPRVTCRLPIPPKYLFLWIQTQAIFFFYWEGKINHQKDQYTE